MQHFILYQLDLMIPLSCVYFLDIVQILRHNVQKISSHFKHYVQKILLSWHIAFIVAAMFMKIFEAKLTIVTM